MKLTKIATMGTLALSIAGLSACNNMTPSSSEDVSTQTPTSSQAVSDMNVVQIAQSNADFSLLVEAVEAAGFAAPLSNPNANFTIF
ncbi:MAG: fasciclin domain-containing protein, partial [Psychrobacter sp.]